MAPNTLPIYFPHFLHINLSLRANWTPCYFPLHNFPLPWLFFIASWTARVWNPSWSLPSCTALGEPYNASVPQFTHMLNGNSIQIAGMDFPGEPVVKSPPANAGEKVPPLAQEDPTHRGATKAMSHSYWSPRARKPVLSNKSHCNERPTHGNGRGGPAHPTRESPGAAMKTQRSQK